MPSTHAEIEFKREEFDFPPKAAYDFISKYLVQFGVKWAALMDGLGKPPEGMTWVPEIRWVEDVRLHLINGCQRRGPGVVDQDIDVFEPRARRAHRQRIDLGILRVLRLDPVHLRSTPKGRSDHQLLVRVKRHRRVFVVSTGKGVLPK